MKNRFQAFRKYIPSGQNRQKKQSEFGTQNTVPCYQRYTPTDCFFGDCIFRCRINKKRTPSDCLFFCQFCPLCEQLKYFLIVVEEVFTVIYVSQYLATALRGLCPCLPTSLFVLFTIWIRDSTVVRDFKF